MGFGLGFGIFLILVGAILAFAVQWTFSVIDLTAVGYICMAVGALSIVVGFMAMRSGRAKSEVTYRDLRGQQANQDPLYSDPNYQQGYNNQGYNGSGYNNQGY